MGVVRVIVILLRAFLLARAALAAENLALRQQFAVLQVSAKRPRLRRRDRVFWVWLSRLWSGWRSCLMIVKPETVVRWHRQGFRLYWRWRSRKRLGRPKTDADEMRAQIDASAAALVAAQARGDVSAALLAQISGRADAAVAIVAQIQAALRPQPDPR